MGAAKEEARMLLDLLPDNATWDDIMYEFYVKEKLAKAPVEVIKTQWKRSAISGVNDVGRIRRSHEEE